MDKINNVHDKFIRSIFADKTIAIEYFKSYLPANVSGNLNFSTLSQLSDTYLSKELRKTMSDIVYSCRTNDLENEIKICLLIEHKSYPDKNTPVQIGGYIFSALQKQIDSKERFSVVIPILLYHGRGKWRYEKVSGLFVQIDPELMRFIPDFDYVYNNLGEIPDEDVEALNNKFLAASLLTLKYHYQKDWLKQNAVRILLLSEEGPKNLQESLIVYFFDSSRLAESRIIELLNSIPSTIKNTVMSTLDIFEKKGKKIGIEIGIQKTRLEVVQNLVSMSDLRDEKIAMIADVSVDFVKDVRGQLSK